MKRALFLYIAVVVACAACLCGCKKEKPFAFPETAAEEYERAYTLQNGKPFDFSYISTFTAAQTLTVDVPSRREMTDRNGNKAYPTTETREYLFDARTPSVQSRLTVKSAVYGADDTVAPTYEILRRQFTQNMYYLPGMSADGVQLDEQRVPVSYPSYGAYFASANSYDAPMQNTVHYPAELFSELRGGVGSDKKTYNLTAKIAGDKYEAFFELFMDDYNIGTASGNKWYTTIADGDVSTRVYRYFVSPQTITDATVDIVTNRDGLQSITVTVKARTISAPVNGLGDEVTVVGRTSYSTAAFSADTIVVPPLKN